MSQSGPDDSIVIIGSFTAESLENAIIQMVIDLTGSQPVLDRPLSAQGLDSLAGMELRQKLKVRG